MKPTDEFEFMITRTIERHEAAFSVVPDGRRPGVEAAMDQLRSLAIENFGDLGVDLDDRNDVGGAFAGVLTVLAVASEITNSGRMPPAEAAMSALSLVGITLAQRL